MADFTDAATGSIADAYSEWLESRFRETYGTSFVARESVPIGKIEKIGIVGAGMSGLYAGLIFKDLGIKFHIFEGSQRFGGRVYTHRFKPEEKNQYFEAGAMRLPCIPSQEPVFDLIKYLNTRPDLPPEQHIELIPYHYTDIHGNLVYVNGTKQTDGNLMTAHYATKHPDQLGFNLRPEDSSKTADDLMDEVMKPLVKEFDEGHGRFFDKYDDLSMRYYLVEHEKWYEHKINYAEVMTGGTNDFQAGLVENVISYDDFSGETTGKVPYSPTGWHTIKNGMDHLPNACATIVGKENITLGAIVIKVHVQESDGKIALTYRVDGQLKTEKFDKVLLTCPTTVLRMMQRPRWSASKEQAIRASNISPLYKIGLQFNTRFWEKVERPTKGGQSISDVPSRWVVYPSYGIGDSGKGVLLNYCWGTDAYHWIPPTNEIRTLLALRDLKELYPHVDIDSEFTGKSKSVEWAEEWSTGLANFLPGQFKHLLFQLQLPEGNIYFAGEHISVRHGWIVGALDSALCACVQILGRKDLKYFKV